ncbi:S-layer homology domain-containing protein [uncultured Merdimonas sp.]|uniref:S-layer homology domain-containing protein n=1 Tax=uncultured Merdimonas sp. TaxID=2023269 RepID=UPI0032097955
MRKKNLFKRCILGALSMALLVPVVGAVSPPVVVQAEDISQLPEPTDEWAAANGWVKEGFDYVKSEGTLLYRLKYTTTYWEMQENSENWHWFISVEAIDPYATTGKVVIPSSVDGYPVLSIARYAFKNAPISEVVISEGVQEVGLAAFEGCKSLQSVSLPNSLLFLDQASFSQTGLKDITIPSSVKAVGTDALYYVSNSITFEGNAPEVLYADDGSLSVYGDVVVNCYSNTTGWDQFSLYRLTDQGWVTSTDINIIQNGEPPVVEATSVSVSPASVTLDEGGSATVTATVEPSDATDKTITWASADPSIATVSNGVITGVKAGSTTVTATCGNASASVAVTVTAETEPDPEEPGTDPGEPTPDPEPGVTLPYTDVTPDAWYYDTVADVYEKGLMTGMDATTFAPVETLARAQFAIILYRMESEPDIAFEATFKDVTDGQWYTDAILWAADASVVTGYSNGNFGPADKINREQMATMMFRYANAKGLDTSQRADFSSYPDASSVSDYARDAMSWCVANGIISGDNGRLNPQGETARAVCATIISRFYNAYDLQ